MNLEDNEINESNEYIELNKIEGNIKEINIEYEKINEMLNKNYEKEKDEMAIEENDSNDIINTDIKDNYKNYNSIII